MAKSHCQGGTLLEPLEIAQKVVDVAADRQAVDVTLLDVRDVCSFADYFVIMSADSRRQSQAVVELIEKSLKDDGVERLRREGDSDSGWILIDFGDVIIHVFAAEEREYYQLERLWADATTLLRIQ